MESLALLSYHSNNSYSIPIRNLVIRDSNYDPATGIRNEKELKDQSLAFKQQYLNALIKYPYVSIYSAEIPNYAALVQLDEELRNSPLPAHIIRSGDKFLLTPAHPPISSIDICACNGRNGHHFMIQPGLNDYPSLPRCNIC
jgi:hypothetical protein